MRTVETNVPPGVGAEAALKQMDSYSLLEIGRKVHRFARAAMQNPEYRAAIDAEIQRLRETGWFARMGVESE